MSKGESSVPWPVWAAVTIVVATLPILYQYFKDRPTKAAEIPQFTYGVWTLHDAIDGQNGNWSNSTLKINMQNQAPDGLLLEGVFEWKFYDVTVGVENVSGRYLTANRQVILEGRHITQYARSDRNLPWHDLTAGSYSAVLSEDGRSLINGTWGSVPSAPAGSPGHWWATR